MQGIAWVSLDETDDESTRFWSYVLTGLQRLGGVTGAPLAALLTPDLSPHDRALPMLLNELGELEGRTVLVLDDYHVVNAPAIHESLEFFLAYSLAGMRVVIATRVDPPLPLARMRAKGELAELRAADLSFNLDEATALLRAVGGACVDDLTTSLLWERTESWAAGLQLAALSIRGTARPSSAAGAIHGDDRHILDYLSPEVLDRLSSDQRDLLVRTSILERLSGPLCDAVLGWGGSDETLNQLDRADLFVVPLDSRHEWYRCHRLFRDALLRELTDDAESARIRLRAADWFLARNHVAEAVGLRLDAGDEMGAAELLSARVPWFLKTGALALHLQFGQRLRSSTLRHDPALYVSPAWATALGGQYAAMSRWLAVAEKSITDQSPPLPGWHTLRGLVAMLRAVEITSTGSTDVDLGAAIRTAAQAVDLEPDPDVLGYMAAAAAD
jgi:LuxR family maltose regulon positive regulatory protein